MQSREFDALVFIGRFQPFHIGHEAVIRRALERAHQVVVLIGSANEARSIKNPWTYEERVHMIESIFRFEVSQNRIMIGPVGNHGSDDRWAADVRTVVDDLIGTNLTSAGPDDPVKIGITGYQKDASSDYLTWFPEWAQDFHTKQIGVFNATDVRHGFFARSPILPDLLLPSAVIEYLREFHKTDAYQWVQGEKLFLDGYAKLWELAPFNKKKPHMITADAVVEQNKHVLLVRRGQYPGKGLLALPGGYLDVDQDYSLRDAAVRELKEETKLSDRHGEIPKGRLGSFIRDDQTKVFDAPDRDLRGRVVTHTFRFDLPDGEQYVVKGSDDAVDAKWYPIGPNLDPRDFYADHFHILAHFFNL